MNIETIWHLIRQERTRQHEQWTGPHRWGAGDCSSTETDHIVKVAVLTEECGEVARAVLDENTEDLVTELVQTAAVAVAWLEALPEHYA